MARYVGNCLGLTYSGGFPLFSSAAPNSGKGNLNYWAWDWLNLYFYDFYFEARDAQGEKLFGLSIFLFSDSGFWIGDSDDPTEVGAFAPVEKSDTKVAFLLYREWSGEFEDALHTKETLRTFLEKGEEGLPELMRGKVFARVYDFADLSDQDSTDRVISEIRSLAESKSLPMPVPATAHERIW